MAAGPLGSAFPHGYPAARWAAGGGERIAQTTTRYCQGQSTGTPFKFGAGLREPARAHVTGRAVSLQVGY